MRDDDFSVITPSSYSESTMKLPDMSWIFLHAERDHLSDSSPMEVVKSDESSTERKRLALILNLDGLHFLFISPRCVMCVCILYM